MLAARRGHNIAKHTEARRAAPAPEARRGSAAKQQNNWRKRTFRHLPSILPGTAKLWKAKAVALGPIAKRSLVMEHRACAIPLTLLSVAIGFCIALPFGLIRARWNGIGSRQINAYVYAFRITPLLVQLYMTYHGLSQFEAVRQSFVWPILRDVWWCALITFSLNSDAYATEIIRGAVQSVP